MPQEDPQLFEVAIQYRAGGRWLRLEASLTDAERNRVWTMLSRLRTKGVILRFNVFDIRPVSYPGLKKAIYDGVPSPKRRRS